MLQQNTKEWLEVRKDKIGASDASIIMGESPFKTPYRLWQEKLGLVETPMNFAMRRGHELEPKARFAFEEATGLLAQPQVCFHRKHTWMMASLDAVDVSGKVIGEIKCPGAVDHTLALQGQIPPKYVSQLQHQMEVCELDEAYYFSFDGEKGVLLKAYRDEKYIRRMLESEEAFFEKMMSLEPPDLCERDFVINESPEWIQLASEWRTIQNALKQAEQEEEIIRKKLISLSGNMNTKGAGIKLSKCVRKGNVDYSKIPEIKDVNLDLYRKKHSEFWKFSPSN